MIEDKGVELAPRLSVTKGTILYGLLNTKVFSESLLQILLLWKG